MTTRREFMQLSSAGIAALTCRPAGSRTLHGADDPLSRSFEHGKPLQEFGYGDVQFAPGIHEAQLEQTHGILMGLNEDSLLRSLRRAAGLSAPGVDLGGWYDSTEFGPLNTLGQWISALSRFYAATEDQATRDKIARLIRGFSQTIEPSGQIYKLGPAYTYDKTVIGMVDAWRYAKIDEARAALEKTTDAALRHLPGKALDELGPERGAHESYTLPENQFIAWQSGASERHYEMAKQYLHGNRTKIGLHHSSLEAEENASFNRSTAVSI